MYQPKYYTLTFMVRKAQTKKSGEVPVFARITISGQRTEFSLTRSVKSKDWNPAKEASDGRSKTDIELNKYLISVRARINEIHAQLEKEEEEINSIIALNIEPAQPRRVTQNGRHTENEKNEKILNFGNKLVLLPKLSYICAVLDE